MKKISIAGFMALLIVLAMSGLHFDRSVFRYADGRPRADFIDNFVSDSVMVGENYINGVSVSMNKIYNIFGIVRKIPIIKDLVYIEEEEEKEKNWEKIEVYELDYREIKNRNKTDLDILPPEEFVEVGDELIVRIIPADYDVLSDIYGGFYRIWFYGENGYYTDYKCYLNAIYKRDGFLGKVIRKVKTGVYIGVYPLGYISYDDIDWKK